MSSARIRRVSIIFVLLATVGLGAWLRLGRLDEMEYKRDEQWTFAHAIVTSADGHWPTLGMPSGINVPNAALSLLVFVGLARVHHPDTPVDLAASVAWLNVAALLLLVVFAETGVSADERDAWRWGAALTAVNPFAVLLQRKLWAQSTLPLFSLLFLIGWFRRETRWGAYLWGFLSALLGQIHMSGLFLAAAVGMWTAFANPSQHHEASTRWRWWASGFAVGAVGLLQWVVQLATATMRWFHGSTITAASAFTTNAGAPADNAGWHFLSLWPSFWWNWLSDAAGFGVNYSLGLHYSEFLAMPTLQGHATWLMAVAAAFSMTITLAAAAHATWSGVRRLRSPDRSTPMLDASDTTAAEGATLGVFGALLTATFHTIHRHYLVVVYPLQWVWLAGSVLRLRRGGALLCGVWLAQLFLTLGVLTFIHTHEGAPGADYGVGYKWQMITHVRD